MLVLAVVVALLVGAGIGFLFASPGRTPPPPRELLPSSPEFRNHQGMARWIERRVEDELVRPLLGEEAQAEARRLLRDFYGEDR